MNIDFNNARLQAAYAFDKLCRKLNEHIEDGKIEIDVDELQKQMDDMRVFALLPCYVYEDGNPELLDLTDKVQGIAHFNPEDED